MAQLALSDLSILIALLRAEGVTHYRAGDLELTLGPVVTHSVPEESKPTTQESQMTDLERTLDTLPPSYRRAFSAQAKEIS